jgi:CHAD domain-containing protein
MRRVATGSEAAPIRAYALQQTRTLLRRLAFQVSLTARQGDPDSVHDLRVAIRRFTQALRVFGQFFPLAQSKKIRRKLKAIMNEAATVRNLDITIDRMKDAGIAGRSQAVAALKKERKQAEQRLLDSIRRSSRNNFSRKWREKLEL